MKSLLSKLHLNNLILLLVLILMIGLLMLHTNPLTTLPSRDSGFFMYAGSQILKGKLPYIDFWDSKGPGIFYINALGLFFGKGSRWGIWLLEYIFLTISSHLFYRSVAKKWGRGAALLSSAAWLYGLSRVWEGGNLTEEYSLFFSFVLLSYFLQVEGVLKSKDTNKIQELPRLSLLLGATLALSFLFRANNIGTQISLLAALVLTFFWQRNYNQIAKTLGWAIVSVAAILGLISAYFMHIGIFSKMFEAAITYNFFYSGAKHHFQLNLWQGVQQIGLPAYIALSGYLAIIYQVFRQKLNLSVPFTLFLFINFPLEIFLSSLSGKNYFHYFTSWMPAIAILVAFAYAIFSKAIFSKQLLEILTHPRKSELLALGLLGFTYWTTGASREYQTIAKRILFERNQGIEQADPVASFLQENTTRDDLVLVWGAYPGLNFLAKRDAPTAYLFYPAYEASPSLEEMGATYFHDLSTHLPKIIVDASSASPDYILPLDAFARLSELEYNSGRIYKPPYQNEVFAFVETNYKRIGRINDFDIYRLVSTGY